MACSPRWSAAPAGERNVEFGAAMATAVNEWQLAHWCDPDPRLLGAIQVNIEWTEAAIAEIEKRAGDRRFAQVNIPPRGLEPLGPPPLLADPGGLRGQRLPGVAASRRHQRPRLDRRRLAVVLPRGASVLRADHADPGHQPGLRRRVRANPQPEDRPGRGRLRLAAGVVLAPGQALEAPEGRGAASEASPSEYVHEHIWVTTQPIEEPERPQDMLSTLEWIGPDRVMFSTDYPHWDQDDPRYAFKIPLPDDWKRKIYRDNAKRAVQPGLRSG